MASTAASRGSTRFLTLALACAVVFALDPDGAAGSVAALVVTVGGVVAGVLGVRRHRPTARRSWWLFVGAALFWALASLIRAAYNVNDGEVPIADILSLVGYACCIGCFTRFVRSARGRRDGVFLDSVVVATGAALVGWMILVVPSIASDRTPAQHVFDVLFPTLDAVLLALSVRLVLAHRRSVTAAVWMCAAIGFVLLADLQWALSASGTLELPVVPQIACYLLGFGCWGAAALHPSMREVGRAATGDTKVLGVGRAAAMGVTFLLPTAAALVRPPQSTAGFIVVSVAAVLIAAIGFIRTVVALRESDRFEERLRYQATHEPLTGLPNRWALSYQLDSLVFDTWDRAGTVGVIQIDVDDLKRVNDTFGHEIGDDLVVRIASRFRQALRPGDLVAHLGGGGFAIAAVVDSRDELEELAHRVLASFFQPVTLDVGEVYVSASVGLTVADRSTGVPTALDLIREADNALHEAKADVERRVVWFDPSMRVRTDRRMELERDLRLAIDRDEFRVFYQPIVSLRSGEWTGFEALVRWEHPTAGLVSPAEFIPLAEDTGLIVPIGELVLREAVRQVAEWRSRFGRDWFVSVNLSVRQLRSPGIVSTIESVVGSAGLPVGTVWIELTESMMMLDDAADLLAEIRAVGTRLAMDDFGTGYSSLSYLKRYPIDRVKIDRAFVSGLGDDADSAAIVTAIIGMASALGLACVAEGVETHEQRRRLAALGCQHAQGFLFSRPIPAADVEALMAIGQPADHDLVP